MNTTLSALRGLIASAGRAILLEALYLWLAARDSRTPAWAKTIAGTALVYLITPIDAIPDPTPILGFTDDAGIIAMAIAQIRAHVDGGLRHRADQIIDEWLN